jgi:hypothetical protein
MHAQDVPDPLPLDLALLVPFSFLRSLLPHDCGFLDSCLGEQFLLPFLEDFGLPLAWKCENQWLAMARLAVDALQGFQAGLAML